MRGKLRLRITFAEMNASTQSNSIMLTEREQEVVDLLVKGSSNKKISSQLDISVNTVKTHLKHIYHKLKVSNRQEVIIKTLSANKGE